MKNGIKHWIFKLKYVVALAIFIGVIGFVGESSLVNRIAQQQEISRLRAEIDEHNRKFEQDKKTLNALKYDESLPQGGDKKVFLDAKDISDYAAEAIATLSSAGLISGDDKGNVSPKAII